MNKLTAMKVSKTSDVGLHGDGGGLWLQVTPSHSKSWIFRYTRHGKMRNMGLGAIHAISLAEAREKAAECRKILSEGKDPLQM